MTDKKSDSFNIFVGAETGLLKGIELGKKSWQNLTSTQKLCREKEITDMCWADDEQTEVCVGHKDRCIDVYSRQSQEIVNVYSNKDDADGGSILRGLARWDSSYVTCTDKGDLSVVRDQQKQASIHVGENINFMSQNPWKKQLVATGGKENDLKIWNLEEPTKPVFRAKNVRHDWLDLRVPVWVMDAAFLAESDNIVTCTGHHQVRVYDPSTPQKRPVLDLEVDEYPLTCLSVRPGYSQVVVGNTHGLLALVDLRGKGHMVQKYKGSAGAVRSIKCHPTKDVVVSCGLDRFIRVYDIASKTIMNKIYLKSRLNCVLLSDTWDVEPCDENAGGQSEEKVGSCHGNDLDNEAEDVIWDKMDVVETAHLKKTKQKVKLEKCDISDEEICGSDEEIGLSDDGESSDEDEGISVERKKRKLKLPKKHKGAMKKQKSRRK